MNNVQKKADPILRKYFESGMDSRGAVKAMLDRLTSAEKDKLLSDEIHWNDRWWNTEVRERRPW